MRFFKGNQSMEELGNYIKPKTGILLISITLVFISCNKNDRRISNLKAFAKLYGYVRWFHPSDEAQQIDWDKFAIYGAAKVEDAPDEQALKDSLLNLFLPIAPSLKIYLDSEKANFNISEITPADTSGYKVIAWQHKGVELNATFYPGYESIRLNRVKAKSKNKFPQVYRNFNASKLNQKNIRLKLLIKGYEHDSLGLYLLPINKYNLLEMPKLIKPIYFKCKAEWTQKEIKAYIQNEEFLVFGVTYNGRNSVLFDDFEIEVKEKEEWKKIEIDNWDLNNVIDNKPEVFYCFPDVNHTVSSKLLDSTNHNYCVEIGKKKDYKLFEDYPKPGELIDERISEGLWIKLPLALWGSDNQTFPKSNTQKLIELQQELNKKESIVYERLGSLVITWNIFQHFYPYFKEVNVDWEKELKIAIHDTYNDKSEHDFLNTLRKFTAKLKDGHIQIKHRSDEWYCLPLAWEWIEGKLVITKVFDKITGLEIGDIVIKIDNVSSEQYFKDVRQYISASTSGFLNYISQITALMAKSNSILILSIKGINGKNKDIQLKHNLNPGNYYHKLKNKTRYEFLENNIIYLNLDKISMSGIDSLMPIILDSRGLICDLRGYPADDFEPFFANLLSIADTVKWMRMRIPKIIFPNNEKTLFNDYEGFSFRPKKPHINIPVVFITDGRAISYAEAIMGIVKYYKLATIVGQPTAGTNGTINKFVLPGNYQVSFTGMKVTKFDGSQHYGIGILPDVYVKKTLKGVRENRDEFLEKALQVTNKEIRAYNININYSFKN